MVQRPRVNLPRPGSGQKPKMRLNLDQIKSRVVRERAKRELEKAEKTGPIQVIIPVRPVPKGRPRIGRGGHAFTPQKTRDFESVVSSYMKAAMIGRAPLQGPVRATIQAHIGGIVATFEEIRDHAGSTLRGDVDNYAKAVLDAANGIIFADDKQVMKIEAEKS